MKKLLLSLLTFCILWVTNTFATLDISQSSTTPSSSTAFSSAFFGWDISFSSDWYTAFVLDKSASVLRQFPVSSAFNVTTINTSSYSSFSIPWNPLWFHFLSSGTRFYTTSKDWYVREYICSTAFTLSSCTVSSSFALFANNGTNISDIFITEDGTKMYYLFKFNTSPNWEWLSYFTMSTPYNLSTITQQSYLNFWTSANHTHFTLNSSGSLLLLNNNGTSIEQFNFSTPYTFSGTTPSKTFTMSISDSRNWVFLKSDESYFYTISPTSDYAFSYQTNVIVDSPLSCNMVSHLTKTYTLHNFKSWDTVLSPTTSLSVSTFWYSRNDFEFIYALYNGDNIENFDSDTVHDSEILPFTFDSLENPFKPAPVLQVSSVNQQTPSEYFQLSGTWTEFKVWNCEDPDELLFWGSNLVYGTVYNLLEPTYNLCFYFEKDFSIENSITDISFWQIQDTYQDYEVCIDEETEDVYIDGELSEISIDDAINGDIYINPTPSVDETKNTSLTSTGSFSYSSYNEASWVEGDTCSMFNSSGVFDTRTTGGSMEVSVDLEKLWVPDEVSWIWNSTLLALFNPINSILTLVSIMTPFWEEDKNYCLLGTVITYKNQRLLTESDLYWDFSFFDYLILFIWSIILWKIYLTYRGFTSPKNVE